MRDRERASNDAERKEEGGGGGVAPALFTAASCDYFKSSSESFAKWHGKCFERDMRERAGIINYFAH